MTFWAWDLLGSKIRVPKKWNEGEMIFSGVFTGVTQRDIHGMVLTKGLMVLDPPKTNLEN